MIRLINGLPGHVLGFEAEGKVTGKDYDTVLTPLVEEKLKTHKKISFLYQLGANFDGFDFAAMIDDAKVGMKNISAWDKVALVSDSKTLNNLTRFFGHMVPCEVKVFKNADLEQAKQWVSQ